MLGPLRPAPNKPQKPKVIPWNTWRKGLNTLLRETEIDGAEMVNSTNLLLVGSGLPTKRWGSKQYFTSGATGTTRFVGTFKDNNDNIQVLSTSDWGYLVKQNGASYTQITGVSWASGYNVEAIELGQKVYLVSQQRALARYDFTTLLGFVTLSIPTGLNATNLSAASGTTTWQWQITATSPVGETIASTPISLATLPNVLTNTNVLVRWNPITPAAGATLTGYNVYRGTGGNNVWVGGTDANTTSWLDTGQNQGNQTMTTPLFDTTGGPTAKYIIRFQDRLILAGLPGQPTKVLISGRYPQHERFDWFGGGGYILVDPDSGEDITGLGVYYRQQSAVQTIVAFKERSVWEIAIDVQTFGNYAIMVPTYRLLTNSQGCTSHRSIVPVENDIMFANTRGIFILRYEPQQLGIINASEISSKIRPFFQGLSYADLTQAAGVYADKKYVLTFPASKQGICFDRERLAFTGPWQFPWNISKWATYRDASGIEHWLAGTITDNNIYDYSLNYIDDNGQSINTNFRSRKEDAGDWTLFKTIQEVFMHFAKVIGSVFVNIYVENRAGVVISAKSFTIQGTSTLGTSGIGTDGFGLAEFGTSLGVPQITAGETMIKARLYQVGRTYQIEIITTDNSSSYQLLGITGVSLLQARDNNPSLWNR